MREIRPCLFAFALRIDIWQWDRDKIHVACANIRTFIDLIAQNVSHPNLA
jgi:hypothetical protein